ncbi:MAG: right-handed parallel beta-helix repeat-containing protein [Gammaproteobacteria bacterium]
MFVKPILLSVVATLSFPSHAGVFNRFTVGNKAETTIQQNNECSLFEAIENANAASVVYTDCPAKSRIINGRPNQNVVSLRKGATFAFDAAAINSDYALPEITGRVIIQGTKQNKPIIRRITTSETFTDADWDAFYATFDDSLVRPGFAMIKVRNGGKLTLRNIQTTGFGNYQDGDDPNSIRNFGHVVPGGQVVDVEAGGRLIVANAALSSISGAAVHSAGITRLFDASITSTGNFGIGLDSDGMATVKGTTLSGNFTALANSHRATVKNSILRGGSIGLYTAPGAVSIVNNANLIFNGVAIDNEGKVVIRNSIISDNYGFNFQFAFFDPGVVVENNGVIVSQNNIWGDNTILPAFDISIFESFLFDHRFTPSSTDRVISQLSPVAANIFDTNPDGSIRLPSNSPAVGFGNPTTCSDKNLVNERCDAGAVPHSLRYLISD